MPPARRKLSPQKPPPSDEQTFWRRFLGDPKRTGAVAPSSPFLAREMARAVDPSAPGVVIELGPGTGPVTRALVARGVRRDRLWLVEFDPHFCRLLSERFPLANIVRGDAYALRATLGGALTEPVAAVVSSLPLLNERPERRLLLLDEAFALMGPEGVFVQFTYGLRSPIPREFCEGRYWGRSGPPVLRNLPPASVWTYRPRGSVHQPQPPKILKLLDEQAEKLGARLKATEALIGRQGDKVKEIIKREAATLARRWPEDRP